MAGRSNKGFRRSARGGPGGGNRIKAGRNEIKARRNKIQAGRNEIQAWRNKIQAGRNESQAERNKIQAQRNKIQISYHFNSSAKSKVFQMIMTIGSLFCSAQ